MPRHLVIAQPLSRKTNRHKRLHMNKIRLALSNQFNILRNMLVTHIRQIIKLRLLIFPFLNQRHSKRTPSLPLQLLYQLQSLIKFLPSIFLLRPMPNLKQLFIRRINRNSQLSRQSIFFLQFLNSLGIQTVRNQKTHSLPFPNLFNQFSKPRIQSRLPTQTHSKQSRLTSFIKLLPRNFLISLKPHHQIFSFLNNLI